MADQIRDQQNNLPYSGVLAARWIVPASSDPINGGWIRFVAGRVVEIGKGTAPTGAVDLGDVAILPQLVNAHTHLEFSDLAKPIGTPGMALHQWIGEVIAARGQATDAEKQRAITMGMKESRLAGVELVGEIVTPPCEYPINGPIELVRFAEVLGLSEPRGQERFSAAINHAAKHRASGISPHAAYSTSTTCIQRCVDWAECTSSPLAMHVAESPEERELLVAGSGPFAEVLRVLGVWRDGLFPWSDDPFVQLFSLLSRAPSALVVHGNDLRAHEIETLAAHSNLSIVYCPRTHAFFGHAPHPVDQLLAAGVRVALGTDSRASNPDLNLWREVQFLLARRSDLNPSDVIAMATQHGADALGRPDLGRIELGSQARLGQVVSEAADVETLYQNMAAADFQPIDALVV